jgi:hypothetical protein
MKKLNIIIALFLLISTISKSQDVVQEFLTSATNDSQQLMEGYLAPFGNWLGSGLNAGWYNTAKPHTFPGFDVTAGVHFITPNNEAMFFTPDLEILVIDPLSNQEIPTFLGSKDGVGIGYYDGNNIFQEIFKSPGGINHNSAVPMPYLQGSIGIIKDTEILFRYAPKIDLQDLEVGHWGVGLKHGIKQWIPGVKKLPFDLSVVGGFSKLNGITAFNSEGQNLKLDVMAFNSNIILSKKIAGFTPYIGLGYQLSKSTLKLNGTYTAYDVESSSDVTITDPINMTFGGVNGFKTNMGARLKLLLFTIHVDWTMAEYNIFTVGIGLNSDIGSRIVKSIEKTVTD